MDAPLPRRRRQEPAQLFRMEALEAWGDQATPQNWILGAIGIGPYQQSQLQNYLERLS
jgi:hypothetical protein